MRARFRARLGDILVSFVAVMAGIVGLITTLGYPERAAMWPSWVMELLILCAGVHLLIVLWQVRTGTEPKTSSLKEDDAS